tara:strand:- start:11491 stop:12717 length:1227 start_codon:yes stop_codon:yes gene_type:complete
MILNLHSHIKLALFYFLIVALLGSMLRLFVFIDVPAEYRFLVHTHSHIALLGWVYVALTTLIYKLYLEKENIGKLYNRIFWFTQTTIAGMLFTFPFLGYALFSIVFSTLFLIASYFFVWLFIRKTSKETKKLFSYKVVKSSLLFMVLSSLGPWALGAIMNTFGSTSIWYKIAIYFYLHFQYNGWFVLALLGFLFFFLEFYGFLENTKGHKRWLWLLNCSVVLTFFLSVLWIVPPFYIYLLAGFGALLQAVVFVVLFLWILPIWKDFRSILVPGVSAMLLWAGVLLAFKIDMQLISAIPYVAMLAYHTPDFVIGYMHLVFLGVVTIALFAFLKQTSLLKIPKFAFLLYLIAFISTELLIFYKGTAIWLRFSIFENYYLLLAGTSILFAVVLFILFVKNRNQNKQSCATK